MKYLVQISKEEYEIIKLELGDINVAVTSRQKGARRKKRYMEESRDAMKLLKQIRNGRYHGVGR